MKTKILRKVKKDKNTLYRPSLQDGDSSQSGSRRKWLKVKRDRERRILLIIDNITLSVYFPLYFQWKSVMLYF